MISELINVSRLRRQESNCLYCLYSSGLYSLSLCMYSTVLVLLSTCRATNYHVHIYLRL